MIINVIGNSAENIADSHAIRTGALQRKIPLFTTITGAEAIVLSMKHLDSMDIYALQTLHKKLAAS